MRITRAALVAWLRQPTTIGGVAALVGDAVIAATCVASWRVELPLALGSIVAMALPDNTAASTLAIRTLRDVLAALASKDPAAIQAAIADAEALVSAVAGNV